jgi:hypothetical protein
LRPKTRQVLRFEPRSSIRNRPCAGTLHQPRQTRVSAGLARSFTGRVLAPLDQFPELAAAQRRLRLGLAVEIIRLLQRSSSSANTHKTIKEIFTPPVEEFKCDALRPRQIDAESRLRGGTRPCAHAPVRRRRGRSSRGANRSSPVRPVRARSFVLDRRVAHAFATVQEMAHARAGSLSARPTSRQRWQVSGSRSEHISAIRWIAHPR